MPSNLKRYEKRFFQVLQDRLPDVPGYREAGAALQTDHRLRTYLADELDRHRDRLGAFRTWLLRVGRTDLLDDVEFLARQMTQLADRLRTADYTYADFFARTPLTYEQMARLYDLDAALVEALRDLEGLVQGLTSSTDPGRHLQALAEAVGRIQTLFEQRTQMTGRP